MGWSATAAACDVIEDVFRIAQHDSEKIPSNVWFNPDTNCWYMAEWGDREYNDGHISGKVSRFAGNPCDFFPLQKQAYSVGSLYIEPSGQIRRWSGMRSAIINAVNNRLGIP